MALNISSGVRIPVIRDDVEVGEIHFNPNDVALVERVYALLSDLEAKEQEVNQRVKALEADTAEGRFGLPANMKERLAMLREVCEDMHAKIDEIFGAGTSEMCFGGALDIDAIWDFFDGIAPELDAAQKARLQKYIQTRGNRQQRRALSKT